MMNETGLLNDLLRIRVRQLSYQAPLCLSVDTPVGEAVLMMKSDDQNAVIVMGEGRVAGIFTERDVMLRIEHQNSNWRDAAIGTLMTENPVCISSDSTLGQALQLMRKGPYRHLPMTEADGKVLAVISIRMIISFIADCFPEEFINLPPSP
jgi:CBS domain-containing protein